MTQDNVIYIAGNTYEHRKKLEEHAFFDGGLKCYVAPISKKEAIEVLAKAYGLTWNPAYQEDFIEPSNEKEWEILKVNGQISTLEIKIEELKISGNKDIENKEIKEKQISLDSLKEKLDQLERDLSQGQTKNFVFRSLAEIQKETSQDWFNVTPPPQPMLLKRSDNKEFLPKGIVGIVAASGGTGKTRLLSQLGFCVASGISFLGEFSNTNEGTGRVFLGLGEEPFEGIRRRLFHVGQHYGHDKESGIVDFNKVKNNLVPHSFYGQNMALIDENGYPTTLYSNLLNQLKATALDGYDLVILDPLSRYLGVNSEKDNDNGTKFISLMERITQEVRGNPTVLVAHHMTKNSNWRSQEAFRGSSSIPAGARWQLNMVSEYEAQIQYAKQDSDKKKNVEKIHLKDYVRADLVKRNDVPPLKKDVILRFDIKGGVLVPATEEEIKRSPDSITQKKSAYSNY